MSATGVEPISEIQVKELLAEVKSFRVEWASFAVHSKVVFDAFREKGASLTDDFFRSYQGLKERKAKLACSIAEAVSGIEPDVWQAPGPNDSLHDFEHKLEDLIKVTRELARLITEKREKVIGILSAVKSLASLDSAVEKSLRELREYADKEITNVTTRASRLADVDLENQVENFTYLLDLANDTRWRLSGGSSTAAALTTADCQRRFESVSAKFGMAIAIEALRSGLTNTSQNNHGVQNPETSIRSPLSQPAPVAVLPHVTAEKGIAATTAVATEAASAQAIQSLVSNFNMRPSPVVAPVRRVVQANRSAEPNPVPLSVLADLGNSLKIKSHGLYPNVLDPASVDTHPSNVKNRAIGYGCLSVMIEIVGYVFTERERNRNFLGKYLHDILLLFAEVQNVVRVEAEQSGKSSLPEQVTAFNWLKHTCSEDGEGILIERFMRLEDRADPSKNPELARRVIRLQKQMANLRETEQGLAQLRQLCHQLGPEGSSALFALETAIWAQVNDCVTQLIRAGLKPSDTRVRDALLPIIDNLPESTMDENDNVISQGLEVSGEFQQVIKSIYDYLTSTSDHALVESSGTESEAVAQVSRMLSEKTMVVVGGVCKPHAAQRLKRELKLSEVRWLEATKRDRVSDFEPELNGAAVVVLITRLIGHKHNDVRAMCKNAEIPCVQLPKSAGYSPNMLASEILRQASEQLQIA